MANTTNFGWETPDDTDLVKDGAAAMRTLGNSIDASFVDLKGGTTGQVLSKNSNTDLDFVWVAADDTNAIQNAIVDAKGDLISATAADTPARLAVGTDGQVLTADSTTSTGLKWAAAASTPTFVGCSVYRTSALNVSNNTNTAVPFDSESFDTDGFHSTSTNTSRITIPSGKAGKYLFNCTTNFEGAANGHRQGNLYKNGSYFKALAQFATITTGSPTASGSTIVDAAVGDYFELVVFQNNGTGLFLDGNVNTTTFSCQYLGA